MAEIVTTKVAQMDGIFPILNGVFAITNAFEACIVLFAIDDLKSTLANANRTKAHSHSQSHSQHQSQIHASVKKLGTSAAQPEILKSIAKN
jgi:hypothetical protein